MIWIILAVYLGGFVAVLGMTLADEVRMDSNKRYLAEEKTKRSGRRDEGGADNGSFKPRETP